jgi:hypothetical protein
MKTEDFDRLKKLCDDNGFELVTESPKENDKFFVVKKKPEKVEVKLLKWRYGIHPGFQFKIINDEVDYYNCHKIGEYLAQKLEEYLNKHKNETETKH